MSDFDLVVSGKVVLTDRIIDGGYVAVKDGKISEGLFIPLDKK